MITHSARMGATFGHFCGLDRIHDSVCSDMILMLMSCEAVFNRRTQDLAVSSRTALSNSQIKMQCQAGSHLSGAAFSSLTASVDCQLYDRILVNVCGKRSRASLLVACLYSTLPRKILSLSCSQGFPGGTVVKKKNQPVNAEH